MTLLVSFYAAWGRGTAVSKEQGIRTASHPLYSYLAQSCGNCSGRMEYKVSSFQPAKVLLAPLYDFQPMNTP